MNREGCWTIWWWRWLYRYPTIYSRKSTHSNF